MSTNTHPDSPPKSKGIPIGEINPDFDGDGKISTLEREIFSKLVAADVDKSGYISSNELYGAITELVESKKRTKALGRLVFGLVVALILSMGCIFVTSIVAGETIKESHVGANGAGTAMTSKNGAAVQVDTVESFSSFYDVASAPIEQLEYIKALNFAVDATTSPKYGGAWVSTVFHLAGALKPTATTVILRSSCGATINVDQAKQTASVTFPDGTTLPADSAAPEAVRRLLREKSSHVPTKFGREEHRRQLMFGTAGSFSTSSFDWASGR